MGGERECREQQLFQFSHSLSCRELRSRISGWVFPVTESLCMFNVCAEAARLPGQSFTEQHRAAAQRQRADSCNTSATFMLCSASSASSELLLLVWH